METREVVRNDGQLSGFGPRQRSLLCLSIASAQRNAGILKPKPVSLPQEAAAPATTETGAAQSEPLTPLSVAPTIPDFHRLAYVEWGDPECARTILCVHGFARNGRDFDLLAERLSGSARVVCPDMAGRGRSDRLSDPPLDGTPVIPPVPGGVVLADYGYNYALFQQDVTALIARLDVDQVDWIGTSMGGFLGMMMAASPNSPVRRLVMNDVGPMVPGSMLDRMVGYLAAEHIFESVGDLDAFLRKHYIGADKFGALPDAQVRHLTKFSERKLPKGKVGLAFDHEAIRVAKWMKDNKVPFPNVELWEVWNRVRCPVLVLRGADSVVLTEDTAKRMRHEGPKATVVVIPNCGHAPALMNEAQIALVDHWLTTLTIDEDALETLGASLLDVV